nr:14173_t:CDS:2 [Entrophospora candida]
MAKQIKLASSSSNLAEAYDLVLTDLFQKLVKMKEGVIKLGAFGNLQKKQRIIRSALNGRTYAYYQNNQPQNSNQQSTNNQTPPNQPNPQSFGLMQIVGAVLPSLLEHLTGQKMTPSGNSTETQLVLSQLLSLQQQILTTQQSFNQRLTALESNASQQLTNLTQQVQSIKSIRLSQEKKQIDFNLQQEEN